METSNLARYRPIVIGIGSLLGLIVLLSLVGFLLPSTYEVKRDTLVKAPIDTVFNTIHDLRYWEVWNPWSTSDDYLTVHYSKNTVGEGAWQHWTSQAMGDAMMKLIEVENHQLIRYTMEFEASQESTTGWFTFEEVAEGVRVTWVDQGTMGNNPVQRYMGLFMETVIGQDFEKGLSNIKAVCE